MSRKRPIDGLNAILAALLAAVLVGWLLNTLLPHLWLGRIWGT